MTKRRIRGRIESTASYKLRMRQQRPTRKQRMQNALKAKERAALAEREKMALFEKKANEIGKLAFKFQGLQGAQNFILFLKLRKYRDEYHKCYPNQKEREKAVVRELLFGEQPFSEDVKEITAGLKLLAEGI